MKTQSHEEIGQTNIHFPEKQYCKMCMAVFSDEKNCPECKSEKIVNIIITLQN